MVELPRLARTDRCCSSAPRSKGTHGELTAAEGLDLEHAMRRIDPIVWDTSGACSNLGVEEINAGLI
jgi:hypothetical protein